MLPIPTTSFSRVFEEMTSCAVHYDVIYQFSIFGDLRVDSPANVSIFGVISFNAFWKFFMARKFGMGFVSDT